MIDFGSLEQPIYPAIIVEDDDPRLASVITTYDPARFEQSEVIIFGVPTDEGIRRNSGREGASFAPNRIRHNLVKQTVYGGPQMKRSIGLLRIVDLGDIAPGPLDQMHNDARELMSQLIASGKIVIALGGGHDIAYPLVTGFKESEGNATIGLINVDAHLDVRPKKLGLHHSGSSFRLLIEEGVVNGQKFCEIGAQSHAIAQSHFDWLVGQGSRILTFEDAADAGLAKAFEECEFALTLGDKDVPIYLSFDMDSVRASDAPGVSAPSPLGFFSEEAIELAMAAGLSTNVQAIDIVEVSPPHDLDDRTSRLAARFLATFLSGVANRTLLA